EDELLPDHQSDLRLVRPSRRRTLHCRGAWHLGDGASDADDSDCKRAARAADGRALSSVTGSVRELSGGYYFVDIFDFRLAQLRLQRCVLKPDLIPAVAVCAAA